MSSVKNFTLLLGALTLLIIAGCQRSEEPFEGPELELIYGDFAVLEQFSVSQASVDFSNDQSVVFKARFTTLSDWKITVFQATTGATKIFSGKSNYIDRTNASWDGTTTIFPSFGTGKCTATLEVVADSSETSLDVNIDGILSPKGTIVADFESGINPDWTVFAQAGADMTSIIDDIDVVPQGKKYFNMAGAVNWDYLIGLVDFPSAAYGANGFDLTDNPDDLYFNVVLNRPDTLSNGFIIFQFKEDENGDGKFIESSEDMYSFEIDDLESGWQVVSIKYSDLESLDNGSPSPARGNNVKNPDKLSMVSCLFLANPASGYAKMDMDYLVFTTSGPAKL